MIKIIVAIISYFVIKWTLKTYHLYWHHTHTLRNVGKPARVSGKKKIYPKIPFNEERSVLIGCVTIK